MNRSKSLLSAACMALILVAVCAATASAARSASYDAKYGTKLLPAYVGAPRQSASQCSQTRDGNYAVLATLRGGFQNMLDARATPSRTATALVSANGKQVRGWKLVPRGEKGQRTIVQNFSPGGELLYLTRDVNEKRSSEITVRLLDSSGKPERGWKSPKLGLPTGSADTTWSDLNAIFTLNRGVLVAVNRSDGEWLVRFDSSGKRDMSFGLGGQLKLPVTQKTLWYVPGSNGIPLLETYANQFFVGASGRPGETTPTNYMGLLKLNGKGAAARTFGVDGLWLPPAKLPKQPTDSVFTPLPSRVLALAGGRGPGHPLGVVFTTGDATGTGDHAWVGVVQLNEKGAEDAPPTMIDEYFSGGDGGFPDTTPFAFGRAKGGKFIYASAESQLERTKSTTFGRAASWDSKSPQRLSISQINQKAAFMPVGYAVGDRSSDVTVCGAVRTGPLDSADNWSAFRAAFKRFHLAD